MGQFLDPETDIMGERYLKILKIDNSRTNPYKIKEKEEEKDYMSASNTQ
jgi:hypothetical protein